MVMSLVWQVFEPLLFGLVGAEVSVEYMNTKVVGKFTYGTRADFKQPVLGSIKFYSRDAPVPQVANFCLCATGKTSFFSHKLKCTPRIS